MKKSLVALAVLGAFTGAAFAQSNVTLYGILDVNYMWEEKPTSVGTPATYQQKSVNQINSGHQFGNRWGVRGTEALGGGLNAVFTLESGFGLDTGLSAQGSRLFGRQAWAGLQGGFGTVVAGRIAAFSSGTGSYDMIGRTDPFGTGFGLASAGNTFISMNALRLDNTVIYVSPTVSGFKAGVGYSTKIDGAETAPSSSNNRALIAGANWTSGPFFAAVTYDVVNRSSGDDQKHLQIGGTFDIGSFRLHAGWADQSNVSVLLPAVSPGSTGVTLPTTFDATSWLLGATWNVSKELALLASYQVFDADRKTVSSVAVEPDFNILSVGATYALSARTNLYASYATRSADGTLTSNRFDAKQLAVGVVHKF